MNIIAVTNITMILVLLAVIASVIINVTSNTTFYNDKSKKIHH